MKYVGSFFIVILLTALTQLGGLAWLIALVVRRRGLAFAGVFALTYVALSLGAVWTAPLLGRVPVSCFTDGPLRVASPLYCALNRTYVSPAMRDVLTDLATGLDARHPGTQTLMLDGNFPFFDGMPLLPHLSHDDGDKADIALFYRDEGGYRPGVMRSPLGYFAFEAGPTDCPDNTLTLRWDLAPIQPLMRDLTLDATRTGAALDTLTADARVGKIFVEPHLRDRLGIADPKLRFQGCRAARHDDHIHLQLR